MTNNIFQFDQIMELINSEPDILVITTPDYLGNNVFSNQLRSIGNNDLKIIQITAGNASTIESVARDIVKQAFPVRPDSKIPDVSLVHRYLEHTSQNKLTPVIIVDDAHKAPIETLKFILELAELRYASSFFRFVLLANDSINQSLDDPSLAGLGNHIIRNVHVPTDTQEETAKVAIEAPKEKPEENIQEELEGLFDVEETDEFLTSNSEVLIEPEEESSGLTSKILLGICFIAIIVAGFYFYPQLKESYFPAEPTMQSEVMIEEPESELAQEETETINDTQAEDQAPDEVVEETIAETVDEDMPEENVIVKTEESAVSETESERDEIEAIYVSEFDEVAKVDREAEDISYEELEIIVQDESIFQTQNAIEQSAEEEISPKEILPETAEDHDEITQDITQASTSETDSNEIEIENPFRLDEIPEFLSGIKGPEWIRQQADDAYTLQLISAKDTDNLKKLLSGMPDIREHLSGYVKYTPSGKPRYLLLYSVYPDRTAAKQSIPDLHEKLQSIPPWPRAMSDVIRELDEVVVPDNNSIPTDDGKDAPVIEEETEVEDPVSESTQVEAEIETTEIYDENPLRLESIPDFLSGIKGPNWIRQQADGAYTLQLISAKDTDNLKKLLSGMPDIREHLSGYVKYTPSGKPRYLLLYSVYPDRTAAKQSISDLHEKLQSIPPWPRAMSDVIRELDEVDNKK